MLRRVILHGALAEKYGRVHKLDANTPNMILRGMCSGFPEFKQDMRDGLYSFVYGEIDSPSSRIEINPDLASLKLGQQTDFHILPEVEGRGRNLGLFIGIGLLMFSGFGAAGVIGAGGGMGATAFGVGAFTMTWGSIAMIGLSLTLGGISQMMAPSPSVGDSMGSERPDERPSFLFNGAVNVGEQGGPIPLVYGQFRTGTTTISAGITTEKLL